MFSFSNEEEDLDLFSQIILPCLEDTGTLDLDSPEFPEEPLLLSFMGSALLMRFQENGNAEDMKRGIRAFELILQKEPPNSNLWANAAENLSSAYRMAYMIDYQAGNGDITF